MSFPPYPDAILEVSHHVRNLMQTANVDEVFIDLCRQIIRKGNDVTQEPEYEPEAPKKEKTRRHLLRRKDGEGPRCTIL